VGLHGIRVLLVDDLALIRTALGAVLTSLGAIVSVEPSAAGALETIRRERPDVLVSDISMPDHDGLWLIAQVRALPEGDGGAIPAVALTGMVSAEDRAEVLHAGFQYHLPRPANMARLAGVIALLALET
jgi:CheY-like chemotaxis protein